MPLAWKNCGNGKNDAQTWQVCNFWTAGDENNYVALLAPSNFCNPKIESTIPICLLWQSWTLYKSADCRWMSITILCVSLQIQRQSAVLNKSNIAIHGLTNQQTISPASDAQRSVLSWSKVYPESLILISTIHAI